MFRRRKQRSWIFARSVLAPWLVRELSPLERSFVYVLIEYLMRKHGNNNPDEKKYFVLFIEERDENVENSHWRFSAYIYIFFSFLMKRNTTVDSLFPRTFLAYERKSSATIHELASRENSDERFHPFLRFREQQGDAHRTIVT